MSESSGSSQTFRCSDCGNQVPLDDDGYAVCWGRPGAMHGKREIARPCGICGDTITSAEICPDCADENPGDAVTPTWGKNRYRDTDSDQGADK